jgi:hypothetical protein
VRRTMTGFDRGTKLGAAAAGIALTAGLAGWGGSIALTGADTTAASSSTAEARPTASPATSAGTPTSATTTQPTASAPSQAANSSSTPSRGASAVPQASSGPQASSKPYLDQPDIAFVSPWRDSPDGQWYYQIGLLGFPPDTVVEISGYDIYGNAQSAPLVMTTAEGSSNPFATRFTMTFPYGGTCDDARPATVTARGKGFSVTETAPRPLECDGGTTSNGPWTPPNYPQPPQAPAPMPAAPPST